LACLPRRDDTDVVTPIRQDDAQDLTIVQAERPLSGFPVVAPLIDSENDEPAEDLRCLQERETVLGLIGLALRLVPLEAHGLL
jgi:hypothetical protein